MTPEKGPKVFLDYDQAALDAAYDQTAYAPNREQLIKRRIRDSELVRQRVGEPERIAYGSAEIERFDIHRVRGKLAPVFIFIHGGAWRSGQRPAEFLIADTLTDSLARLTGTEQRAAKTTDFDLQLDPSNSGMHFHRLDRPRNPNFWSVRVNSDIRIIVHKTATSLLLCYVGHHDAAYSWAERRKIDRALSHNRGGSVDRVA